MMSNITIFIDEAGTLPDTKDKIVIITAVAVRNPTAIQALIKTTQKKYKLKKQLGELKFYTAGDKTKTLFFQGIAKEKIDIFILIIDKNGRKIPDTPKHYALLCWLLLTEVFNYYKPIQEIIFDRHFYRTNDLEMFTTVLKKLFKGKLPSLKHVDSKINKVVNLADMVAGTVLARERGKDNRFYEMINDKIISETKINWIEAKRRLFQK